MAPLLCGRSFPPGRVCEGKPERYRWHPYASTDHDTLWFDRVCRHALVGPAWSEAAAAVAECSVTFVGGTSPVRVMHERISGLRPHSSKVTWTKALAPQQL